MNNSTTTTRALQLFKVCTEPHCQIGNLTGPIKVSVRTTIMGLLLQRKVSQKQAGINALRDALFAAVQLNTEGKCLAELEHEFATIIKGLPGIETESETPARISDNNVLGNVAADTTTKDLNTKEKVMSTKVAKKASKKSEKKSTKKAKAESVVETPAAAAPAPVAEKPAEKVTEKPAMQEWPKGHMPYLLEGTEKLELITKDQAEARNAKRVEKSKAGKWLVVPDADPSKVAGPFMNTKQAILKAMVGKGAVTVIAIATASQVHHETVTIEIASLIDGEFIQPGGTGGSYKITEKGEGEAGKIPDFMKFPILTNRKVGSSAAPAPAAKEDKAEDDEDKKPAKREKPVKDAKDARPVWTSPSGLELGMCELIRACGHLAMERAQIMFVCKQAGFEPSPTTISIQSKKGRDGESLPALKDKDEKALKAWAKEVPAKAKKADKSEDKPKVRVKPTVEADDEDDADEDDDD